jgi:hypothetical protein
LAQTAPRCGAKTRSGSTCRSPAIGNGTGRCRLHGGWSCGPRTVEGLARMVAARTKHGKYTAKAVAFRQWCRQLLRGAKRLGSI